MQELEPFADFEVFDEQYVGHLNSFKKNNLLASEVDFLNECYNNYKMLVDFVDGDFVFKESFEIESNGKKIEMTLDEILISFLSNAIESFLHINYNNFIRGFPFINKDLTDNRYIELTYGLYTNGFGIFRINPTLVKYILGFIFIDYGRIRISTNLYNDFKFNVLKICRFIRERRNTLIIKPKNNNNNNISKYITLFEGNENLLKLTEYLIDEFNPEDGRTRFTTKFNQIYFFLSSHTETLNEKNYTNFIQECYNANYKPSRINGNNPNHQKTLKNIQSNFEK